MKRSIMDHGPVIALSILIFWLSSRSTLPLVGLLPGMDKLAHMSVFGILGLTAYRSFSRVQSWAWLRTHAVWSAFVFVALYGLLDEFHQSFVPGRSSDVFDLTADTAGAGMALLLWRLIERRTRSASHD